jgi:hypothetical protein
MASITGHWWGFGLHLEHHEACAWTQFGTTVGDVSQKLSVVAASSGIGALKAAIIAVAAGAFAAANGHIRNLNQNSGGRGVTVKFLWTGIYIGASRRGRSSQWRRSPCP